MPQSFAASGSRRIQRMGQKLRGNALSRVARGHGDFKHGLAGFKRD
jgi:hypothetical protein